MKNTVSICGFNYKIKTGNHSLYPLNKRFIFFSVTLCASLCKFFLVTQSVTESHGVSQR